MAQEAESTPSNPDKIPGEDQWLVEDRDREVMHAGMPFDLIGIDEGDTDFRSRTSALSSTDGDVTFVDPQENYERRLAMYNKEMRFHAPLPTDPSVSHKKSFAKRKYPNAKSATAKGLARAALKEDTGTNLTPYLLATCLLALVVYRRKVR